VDAREGPQRGVAYRLGSTREAPAACGGPKALARTWSKFGDHDRFRASDSEPASQGRTDEVVLYVLTAALRDVQMGRERAAEREGEPADGGSEPDVEWAGEQLVHARVAGALVERVEAQMVAVHEAGEEER
jgi:hypothetical protein